MVRNPPSYYARVLYSAFAVVKHFLSVKAFFEPPATISMVSQDRRQFGLAQVIECPPCTLTLCTFGMHQDQGRARD